MTTKGTPSLFSLAPEQLKQIINPLNWWGQLSGQYGLINVNQMASSDPALEADIVHNVAGYGKQLGRITEALAALCANLDTHGWPRADVQALKAFREMAAEIATTKAGHLAPTDDNIDKLVAGIRYLRGTDEDAYRKVCARLQRELFPEEEDAAGRRLGK